MLNFLLDKIDEANVAVLDRDFSCHTLTLISTPAELEITGGGSLCVSMGYLHMQCSPQKLWKRYHSTCRPISKGMVTEILFCDLFCENLPVSNCLRYGPMSLALPGEVTCIKTNSSYFMRYWPMNADTLEN